MPYDRTPLSPVVLEAVRTHWAVCADAGERLHGGEESAAFRIGDHVVRIGPGWRSDAELEWAHAVASAAAGVVSEAIAPLPTAAGATIVRVHGRPLSVWPYRPGAWPAEDAELAAQAAALLARLHRVLAGVAVTPRPGPGPALAATPDLQDESLDAWLADVEAASSARQLLHGDYYSGNVLVHDGRITTVLDWDEALVGPPERELAWAAWEWGDGLDTLDLAEPLEFVEEYLAAGGTARRIDETTLAQFVRERIRREVAYSRAAPGRGVISDEDDREYEARQIEAFSTLRPRTTGIG